MATSTTITGLPALSPSAAPGDYLVIVDVSDTGEADTGTTKKILVSSFLTAATLTGPTVSGDLAVGGDMAVDGDALFSGSVTITGGATVAGGLTVSSGTLTVAQTSQFTGTVGIGQAAASNVGLIMSGINTTGSAQGGAQIRPTFNASATSFARAIDAQFLTQAAGFTISEGSGLHVNGPSIGAGSDVTTMYGLFIDNQAVSGVGTAYAIYTNGGRVRLGSLPTSASGLASGTLWNNSGVVNVV